LTVHGNSDAAGLIRKGGHRTHPNLKDTAADYIRDQILSGVFYPGGKVDQDEIATTLGISRLPVREALIELAQEGLVEAIPRRGAFVVELDVDDILDHYRVYGLVAGLAARRCAEKIDAADLAQLRAVHEELTACTDPARQGDLNVAFHRIINHAGGSRQLLSILWFLGRAMPIGLFRFAPAWESAAAAHHGLILTALEARDPESAAASVERHLREAGSYLVETLRANGYWSERPPAE
jgi:DNA-binding GntR family transcriptional regulator